MKLMKTLVPALAAVLLLTGCGKEPAELPELSQGEKPEPAVTAPSLPPETETGPTPEEIILEGMTLREKVGQLFIVRPDALEFSIPFETMDNSTAGGMTGFSPAMAEALKLYPVGGIVHFQKNILDPDQITAFNSDLTSSMKIPPFIAVDEEGGIVARLADNYTFGLPRFDSPADVGSRGVDAAQEMGWIIGNYLTQYGFNMNFAPVADVNTNPNNPVIGKRAFSTDPQKAALCARAMADGLRMNGILPVFKHFPGHGDTAEDSHQKLAVSRKTAEELLSCEWIPFRQAEASEAIMVGHIALPEVTGDQLPATFSPEITTDFLKNQLSFQGLVITDSLSMGAVISQWSPGEAALLALRAGCDLLLMPASLPEAFDSVAAAVENGDFPQSLLDEIVLKILKVKLDYHIIDVIS